MSKGRMTSYLAEEMVASFAVDYHDLRLPREARLVPSSGGMGNSVIDSGGERDRFRSKARVDIGRQILPEMICALPRHLSVAFGFIMTSHIMQ